MRFFFLTFSIFLSGAVWADVAFVNTKVKRVQVSQDSEFGGCLARPSETISGVLNCPDSWVTLDCAGVLGGSKSAGSRRFDQISLAILMDKKVTLRINDEQKINGWCFADRVAINP